VNNPPSGDGRPGVALRDALPTSGRLGLRGLFGLAVGSRFFRYTAGSGVAFASSEIALIVCYGSGLMGSAPASVVAFFAGALPNYILNRSWVWQRKGPIPVRRELLPYALVSLVSLVTAAVVTGLVAARAPGDHATKTAFVAAAYLGTYTVLFLGKFVVYQRVIFQDAAADDPSEEVTLSAFSGEEVNIDLNSESN
jgi:putative flippase GtrA